MTPWHQWLDRTTAGSGHIFTPLIVHHPVPPHLSRSGVKSISKQIVIFSRYKTLQIHASFEQMKFIKKVSTSVIGWSFSNWKQAIWSQIEKKILRIFIKHVFWSNKKIKIKSPARQMGRRKPKYWWTHDTTTDYKETVRGGINQKCPNLR